MFAHDELKSRSVLTIQPWSDGAVLARDCRGSYEIKQLTVPVDQAEKVKNFYAIIAGDERSMVVLKPAQQ